MHTEDPPIESGLSQKGWQESRQSVIQINVTFLIAAAAGLVIGSIAYVLHAQLDRVFSLLLLLVGLIISLFLFQAKKLVASWSRGWESGEQEVFISSLCLFIVVFLLGCLAASAIMVAWFPR